jgi:glycosidase
MEFHISRAIREAAQVDDQLFGYSGNVVFANVAASRKLAAALNQARGAGADPAGAVNAGALFAMGLIDELSHALVARYRSEIDPAVLSEAVRWFAAHVGSGQTGSSQLERLLLVFTQQFPNAAVFRGELTAAQWLNGATDRQPNREAALEELLLLWIANLNPAFAPFQTLFADQGLKQETVYANVTAAFPGYFSTRPPMAAIGSLYDALRAPSLASPDSLIGQLDFIREHWSPYLGDDLRRILLAIDVIREEDLAIWMRFHPPGPDQFRHGAPTWGTMGFVGDEFIGFDEDFRRKKRYATDYQAPLEEYENFSADQAWMPNVVLMAKSTYVWLEQLSKKYGRHIHRLDHIPDEELQLLAARGITGLWLIGLWERSTASQIIKRLRGHHDAVASAYSLKSYDIAEDLGGWAAYEHLKRRAAAAGLRLASDMVPNHMGIDSPWVIEHPDWFIHRWESPFPAYSFNGPNLSTDSRVEIKIDDHYYDQTDAAVAFRLRNYGDGSTRYVYHGNDGTTFAWNDTAQLDYSKAYVREHVIQTILHVARLFPIIRFDAAMVLAKRHVQRLWFPLPGAGGSIPSRAENAMSQEDFDALMPHEFWREVVDRVAAEVPGTLLLAEAFWLLEGYFVRTLGMHRVYNSAFMNMLRDEENAKYRSYLKKTIEFDPDIMKRYVNFMSNPDERTAIDQFGDSDKYFGVCTLLATLPGLPMFGHGQIEGFTERYGMEFKRARLDEGPSQRLVERHQREIAPLLKQRRIFAGSAEFILYDFWTGYGTVNENVFAYSNRTDGERSLVVYNNKYDATQGTIHVSTAAMDKSSGSLRQWHLAEGLALPYDDSLILAYRDSARGLEYLRRSTDIHRHGLSFDLGGFQCAVLLDWRERRSSAEYPWDWLCDTLQGAGVANLDEEIAKLRLRPLHDALREAIGPASVHALAEIAAELAGKIEAEPEAEGAAADRSASADPAPRLRALAKKSRKFFDQVLASLPANTRAAISATPAPQSIAAPESAAPESATPESTYAEAVEAMLAAAARLPSLASRFAADWPAKSRPVLPGLTPESRLERTWAPVLAWIVLSRLPALCDPHGDRAQLFDRLLLRSGLADIFSAMGMEGEAKWQAAAQVRVLLIPAATPQPGQPDPIRSAAFFSDPDVRWLAGVNHASGTTYFNKEQFEELLTWLHLPLLLQIAQQKTAQPAAIAEVEVSVAAALEAASAAGYDLEAYLSLAESPQPIPANHPASQPELTANRGR